MAKRNTQADAHLAPWLKAEFGLTVQHDGSTFVAFQAGGNKYAAGETVFWAALEYAACYWNAEQFEKLVAIETGAL